ncbi:MAG: DUF5050 domain-containing protein [Defluviitaleaceae bacterium]|nr:DUF5050 domain-containing protein [Defluviitaleaceae bacterium]
MPLPIDVKPYVLNGVIGGDNYLTHYKATGEQGEEYVITEFFPVYMVKREDDGTLGISERFQKEFLADREDFIRRAEAFKEIRDASLHPVVEIFERNQTAYIVRRACGMTGVMQFMGGQTMAFDEAFHFIRPLLVTMAQLAEKGVIFNISFADFRVNNFKQLVLCAPPSRDTDFHPPIIHVIRLYYRLITGEDAPERNAAPFSAYGIEVPARIEQLVMEILEGDILYGSLDDFYKRFKSLLDGLNDSKDTGAKTLAVMRGAVAGLFVVLAFSLIVLVIGGVRAYESNFLWANPEKFSNSEAIPTPSHDFSSFTITHPRNSADALSGSFSTHAGFRYFRGEGGLMSYFFGNITYIPGAANIAELAEARLIIPDVLPSYIVGHTTNNSTAHIFFVDMSDGFLYRATTTGEEKTIILEFPVLNLAVVGDFLYYTSVNENNILYRLDIKNLSARPEIVHDKPVSAITTATVSTTQNDFHYLFFVSYENGKHTLYSWIVGQENIFSISSDVSPKTILRISNETLFFIDAKNKINSCTFDGRKITAYAPENVLTFDVNFNRIFFTEIGRHVPRSYHMNRGTYATLSADSWVSYIWANDDNAFGIDHRDPSLVHTFEIE